MFRDVFHGSRVFVTGHTGFKGSWLTLWLLELGAEVAGYSRSIPTEPSNFEVLGLEGRLSAHTLGDVRDLDRLSSALREFAPTFVFHLAAQSLVRAGYDDPVTTFATNALGSVHVLEAIRHVPSVRAAVIVTSDKCYENLGWDWGYRENDRLGGADPYSASKACAEIAFSAFARSYYNAPGAAKIASARAGNVIGGGDWAVDRLVPDCARAWGEGRVAVLRSPASTRPWQHVLEPLSGYLSLGAALATATEGVAGESFNFGPSAESDHTVAELVAEMCGGSPTSKWAPEASAGGNRHEAELLKLSCDKALRRLAWRPTFTFREAARATAEWYRAYYVGGVDVREYTVRQLRDYQSLAVARSQAWAG